MTTRVKICCIASVDEARLAVAAGASALGLVSEMPSGPGVIPESLIAEIASHAPPAIGTFLLTCQQDVQAIVTQQRRCRTNTVQICDRLTSGTYHHLRDALPGISLVQVIHVRAVEDVDEAQAVARHVDAILLDSGNQTLAVKELGGTGRVHNWQLSRQIRDSVQIPVFLAGGLRPDNVAQAVREVRPFAVDVCSGVRTAGRLDHDKLAAFIRAVQTVDDPAALEEYPSGTGIHAR